MYTEILCVGTLGVLESIRSAGAFAREKSCITSLVYKLFAFNAIDFDSTSGLT